MTQDSTGSLSSSVRAEAAAWVARLHSSGRSRALEAGLRSWLKADPAHARAFEVATEAWEIGGSLPGAAVPRMADPFTQPQPSFRSRSRWAIAAAVCVALIGALLYTSSGTPPVSTAVGEQRMLTLEDGTRIFLNTDTRLFVEADATQRRVKLENGEALFDVAKDPRRPFVVAAGDQEVIALGTSFLVRRDERGLAVTLVEGKVAVAPILDGRAEAGGSAAQRVETVLVPGQRLTFQRSDAPVLDEPSIEKVTAWRRGEVILDKTRLQDAAREMNRYSTAKLVIVDAATADIRVSGIFRAGDSARFAQALAETYHLTVDHQSKRIVLSGSRD